jgi:hypothetical protein
LVVRRALREDIARPSDSRTGGHSINITRLHAVQWIKAVIEKDACYRSIRIYN